MGVLKLAMRLSWSMEQNETSQQQQYGSIEMETEAGKGIPTARGYTADVEVYNYLTSALAPWP